MATIYTHIDKLHMPGEEKKRAVRPRLWIVEVDRKHAHIYEETSAGTEWVANVCLCKSGDLQVDNAAEGCSCPAVGPVAEATGAELLSDKTNGEFLKKFADWLSTAEREKAFDRLVLVANPGPLHEICSALSKRIENRLTLRPREELGVDDSDERLAEMMWH